MEFNIKTKPEDFIDGFGINQNIWALDIRIKSEVRLLMILSSLTAKYGYAWITNSGLSAYLSITEISVSNQLSKLQELGYIEMEYKYRGAEVIQRKIRLKKILIDDYKKLKSTVKENFKDKSKNIKYKINKDSKVEETSTSLSENSKNEIIDSIEEKVKENIDQYTEKRFPGLNESEIINLFNTVKNDELSSDEDFNESKFKKKITTKITNYWINKLSTELIDWFNSKFKKKYRVTGKLEGQLKSRLKEGYSLDDIKIATEIAMTNFPHNENGFKYLTPVFMTNPNKLNQWLNSNKGKPNKPTIPRDKIPLRELLLTDDENILKIFQSLQTSFGITGKHIPENKETMEEIFSFIKTHADGKVQKVESMGNGENPKIYFEPKINTLLRQIRRSSLDPDINTNLYGNNISLEWLIKIFAIK